MFVNLSLKLVGSASPSYSLTSPNPQSPHQFSPVSPTYSPASMSYSMSSHPSMSPSFHQPSSYSPLSPQQYVSIPLIFFSKTFAKPMFFSLSNRPQHHHLTVRHRQATGEYYFHSYYKNQYLNQYYFYQLFNYNFSPTSPRYSPTSPSYSPSSPSYRYN